MDLIISPCAQLLTLAGDPAPIQSLQMILSLACTQMRMTPAEAIVAATINGAHALGRAGGTVPSPPAPEGVKELMSGRTEGL